MDNLSVRKTIEPIVTFDDGEIPEVITGASGTSTIHTIVDRGAGDKALHVEKKSNTIYGGGFYCGLTEVADVNANTFIFECDMYVTKYNGMAVYITTPETSTSGNVNYTNIISSGTSAVTFGSATAPVNEWIHFKLEYYKYSETQGRTVITITSSQGTKTQTYTKNDTIAFDEANMIMFNCQTATVHDVIYDNISCRKVYVSR